MAGENGSKRVMLLGNRLFQAAALGALGLVFTLGARAEETNLDWAKERQFWSFRVPVEQSLPDVQNRRWPRERIDYFILQRLEQSETSPSLQADRRTLARRLYLDLTGLPPTPSELDAFLADSRPGAYQELVERLLASPRFGERMASLWLPLARYAEDQAHQVGSDTKFFYPNAFRYREWVIDAFNSDLAYDRFIKLQLAADKLGDVRPQDLAALGFIGLGPKYYNRGRIEVMADEWEDRVDTVARTTLGLTVACARCHDHKFEPITMSDYYALAGVFASTKMLNRTREGKNEKADTSADKMDASTLHIVEDGEAKDLNIFIRGDPEREGPKAERRFLHILSQNEPEPFRSGSGRGELADAIASQRNPLTARVMVNRIWGAFFGKPLVPTPSNFGHSGLPPSHPELLDDLAARFMNNGWSVKWLVREIVSSATYQQASRVDAKPKDPANELLGRMNRRRLSVEQWRDSVLFVSDRLEFEGGKSLELDDPANHRRTLYGRISRLKLNDLLMQFDYPDANVHAEARSVTTSPTQKLFMLNNPFMIEQAKALAARVSREPSDRKKVERLYRICFARPPEPAEAEAGLRFLAKAESTELSRLAQYAQALLASNEMLYVD